MSTFTETTDTLAAKFGITATVEPAAAPRDDETWGAGASHWTVTLRHEGDDATFTTPFSMGSAHTHTPTAGEVFHAVLMDAMSAEEEFDDWAIGYGYDPDSRKAYALYEAVQAEVAWLRLILTDDEFDVAMADAAEL